MPYFFIFFYFFECANFILILASTAIVSSELAGASKLRIEQQISIKKALNFCATFIRVS